MKYREPSPKLILHEVLLKTLSNPKIRCGICGNVTYYLLTDYTSSYPDKEYKLLLDLMAKSPKHSGDESYPVKGYWFLSPKATYILARRRCKLWKGAYGKRRIRLLKWLIAQTAPGDTP